MASLAPDAEPVARRDLGTATSSRGQAVDPVFVRQKRKQVARACDECRACRIKCDSGRPCANCSRKSRVCSNGTRERPSALAIAEKKINDLESNIRQLRQELEHERAKTAQRKPLTPSSSSTSQESSGAAEDSCLAPKRAFNYGVSLRPPRSSNDSWFGPSCLYYFITRLAQPLGLMSQPSTSLEGLLTMPSAADTSKLVGEKGPHDGPEDTAQLVESMTLGGWNSMQEQYFIDRYWEGYHTAYMPIIDEAEFKAHHQSLWSASGGARKPSALVDIVVAVCMQLGDPTSNASNGEMNLTRTDGAMAGRRYYRRCQALLTYEMESPSLATLQCRLLSALYVCAGSFHNMMDACVALAVRTAYVLKLHLDPPESMSPKEKEKRRRLWWATYLLETKIATKLGRPFSIDDGHAMPQLPRDDMEAAALSGSLFAPIGPNETWLSFNRHHIALYKDVRQAHIAFFNTCATVSESQSIWDNAGTLEVCARTLIPHRKRLREWRDSVPSALRQKRRDGGVALSTDGTAILLEPFAPLWLQRQRLLLELAYHHLSINMLRPLVSFSSRPQIGGHAEALANDCASHAIAFTRIVHQVLTTEETLTGWHETFHWQWNATITLVGCLLAKHNWPSPDLPREARHAVDLAAVVCEEFAKTFAVARRAAKTIRELCIKIDALALQPDKVPRLESEAAAMEKTTNAAIAVPTSGEVVFDVGTSVTGACFNCHENPIIHNGPAPEQDLFDIVLSVDFWNDMDVWWPDSTMEM
ncbi:fungal-specific transcription factor domain-containing protein [Emericellopsis atlantica]|uniref:Fungal-specific transcription factor domain-containing protein n=1 Tax=Emericellopsis atlantica TaxID=2614577 RepID=A0A9P8CPC0_9HYPO|nr:fungal-specific transcription factor domain-containing protein [Emericellopsis atlantica]KAG9253965.1 fungal-specific transcription factor domain-containing protein [Emericellopsis atlantica]